MIRLMGILTGSALAVAMLIVVLGLPQFAAQEEAVAEHRMLAANMLSPDTGASREPEPAPKPEPAPEPEPEPKPEPEPQTETAPAQLSETAAQSVPMNEIEARPPPRPTTATERQPIEQNWYAFWSPFRSEIAADGFILELQKTTGLDYRVVKLKPGTYEVAFAYTDDADIEDKLNRISTATGLDMTGG